MLRLAEHLAADGSPLFDVVADAADGTDRVIYRGPDRAHVAGVLDDLTAGRLQIAEVQAVLQQVILSRSGGPKTVFVGGRPLPWPFKPGTPQDRWAAAAERIGALRAERRLPR